MLAFVLRRLLLLLLCVVVCELIAEVVGGLAFQAIDDALVRRYAIGGVQIIGVATGLWLFIRMGRER